MSRFSVLGKRSRTSERYASGSWPWALAVSLRLVAMAQASPPRSRPANSEFLRADGDLAQCAFCGVVVYRHGAVVYIAGQCAAVSLHIGDGRRGRRFRQQFAQLFFAPRGALLPGSAWPRARWPFLSAKTAISKNLRRACGPDL